MTTPNENIKWATTGDGATTIFSYDNKIFATTDLEVYLDQVLQSAGYSVSIDGDGIGNVTFDVAPGAGVDVVLTSAIPALQSTDFVNGEGFDADGAVEASFDRAMRVAQQTQGALGFALRLQDGDPAPSLGRLPLKSAMANKLIGGDSVGDPIAVDPTDASSTAVTAAGSASPRLLANRFGENYNVLDDEGLADYDPVARTGTNNSAAFNTVWSKMVAQAKASAAEPGHTPNFTAKNIIIPPGFYRIDDPIDWTDTQIQNVHVWAYGAVLYGRCAGKAVVDLLGSRYVTVHGLTVYGDPTDTPREGIQYGRISSAAVGNNHFIDVTTDGEFTLTGVYNVASETTRHDRCRYQNSRETDDTFAYIGDGRNHWAVASDHVTISIAQPEEMSFTNNFHASCEFRHWGGYDPVWLSSTTGHKFDEGCYLLAFDQSNVRLWSTSISRHTGLSLYGLFESNQDNIPSGSGNTGAQTAIEIEGDGTATAISGFVFKPTNLHAESEVIKLTNTGATRLDNADIAMPIITEAGAKFVPNGTNLTISGRLSSGSASKLNLGQITAFNGDILVDDLAGLTLPPDGAYRVNGYNEFFSIENNKRIITFDGFAAATFAAGVMTVSRALSSYAGAGETVTDVDWDTNITTDGLPLIIIRNSGAGNITFTYNAAKIRTLTGANVVCGPNEAMTFIAINSSIVQQIGGSV